MSLIFNQNRLICPKQIKHSVLHNVGTASFTLAVVTIGLFASIEKSFAVFITFVLFGAIGYLFSINNKNTKSIELFIIVYSINVMTTIALYLIYMDRYGIPYYIGGSDDFSYELSAREAATRLGIFDYINIRGTVVETWHNSVGYVYLVSLFYRLGEVLGGFHTMIPRLFNCMCLGLMAILLSSIAKQSRVNDSISTKIGWFIGLFPIMMYGAAHTFRDISISLLTLLVTYLWTPTQSHKLGGMRWFYWIVTTVLILIAVEFRRFQAFGILAIALVSDASSSRNVRQGRWLYSIVLVTLCITSIVLFWDNVWTLSEDLEDHQVRYTEYRLGLSDGLATFVFNASPPWGYFLRVGYALISPLPMLSSQPDHLWLSLGTSVQIFFVPFLGAGIILALRDRTKWHILTAFLVFFIGVAFISFSSRHIVQFFPYAAILTAIGFERFGRYRMFVWFLMAGVGVTLIIAYVFLKS